ncbi:hypothetical protein Kisp02_67530 [Kineosporia sp. NBRC 101731]|nr:hypothetical protein Kisp02_67530 [Kineosporia sp. NBRC 101731]
MPGDLLSVLTTGVGQDSARDPRPLHRLLPSCAPNHRDARLSNRWAGAQLGRHGGNHIIATLAALDPIELAGPAGLGGLSAVVLVVVAGVDVCVTVLGTGRHGGV